MLAYELYAFASRNPELSKVMGAWLRASGDALARHFATITACVLDAFVDGFSLYNSFDAQPISRRDISAIGGLSPH